MKILVPLALALAVLAAGCLGGGETAVAPAATPASPTSGDVARAPGSVARNATKDGATANATVEKPTPVATRTSKDGATGTFACYFVAVQGGCQGNFDPSSTFMLAGPGDPLTIEGTLTWNTSSPTAAQGLSVYVVTMDGNGVTLNATDPHASGPSPLKFRFDIAKYAKKKIALDVNSFLTGPAVPAPVFVGGSVAQKFHVDFTFTTTGLAKPAGR